MSTLVGQSWMESSKCPLKSQSWREFSKYPLQIVAPVGDLVNIHSRATRDSELEGI